MPMTERIELTLENLADLDDGKVQLMFAAELKRALQRAQSDIRTRLESALPKVPIFNGRPERARKKAKE